MCIIKTPDSPLCVSPPGSASSPGMQRPQAESAGGKDTQTIEESNEFFMHVFKVSPCAKTTLHEWNTCCYAHAGEKAARRDPKQFRYSSVACPEMLQSGKCPRGDFCDMAHSVFEYWLHPQRYRTTLCRDSAACHRSVCFFAHGVEQLRPLTAPVDAASSDNPFSTKGKFSLSGLPAAVQRRRSQEKLARQNSAACSRGPARQGSGGILQQQQQQRMALVGPGNHYGRSSSGSFHSVAFPASHASSASTSSVRNSCVSSPVTPMPVLLPRANSIGLAAATADGLPGVGQINDLLAAYQAHAISSQQRAAIAQAVAAEAKNQLAMLASLGGMLAEPACCAAGSSDGSAQRYAGTACSTPNVFLARQVQLQGSPAALNSPLSMPASYGCVYSPTIAGSLGMSQQPQQQPQQQQQVLVSCSSLGPVSSSVTCMNSADGILLPQLSPAASLGQPGLVPALSADAAFMSMPLAGLSAGAAAAPQVSSHAHGAYMHLAAQSAGLAW